MEEPKDKTQDKNDEDLKAIDVIKEEYAKKVEELEAKHKQELEEQEKRLEKKHAEQIRHLFLDGTPDTNKGVHKEDNNDDDKTFYERVEEKMKAKLKLN